MAATDPGILLFTDLMSQKHGVGVELSEEDGTAHLLGMTFSLKTRSLPPVVERLLEPIAVHALRHHSRLPRERELLIITVERLPLNYLRILDEAREMIGGRLTNESDMTTATPGYWAIVSEAGGYILNFPTKFGNEAVGDTHQPHPARSAQMAISRMRDPFRSDHMLRILKVLLARAAIEHELLDPKLTKFTSTSSMANALEISESSAYSAIKDLVERDWVRVHPQKGPVLLKPGVVARWWLDAAKEMKSSRVYLKPLFRAKRPHTSEAGMQWLQNQKTLRSAQWAINGWSAIDLHQKSILTSLSTKLFSLTYVGGINHLLGCWEMEPCEVRDPEIFMQVDLADHIKSTVFGAKRVGNVQFVDLWQAAVDVSCDRDRGIEQAEAIMYDLFEGA